MAEFEDPEIFRSILEDLPIGLDLVDRDRRILFWSGAAEEITGYLRQDVVGRHCRDDILMPCLATIRTRSYAGACSLLETMNDSAPRGTECSFASRPAEATPAAA